jgi:hypothetical protein
LLLQFSSSLEENAAAAKADGERTATIVGGLGAGGCI